MAHFAKVQGLVWRGSGGNSLCRKLILLFGSADPVLIENGTFSWDPETTILRHINLRVKQGTLVGKNRIV